MSQSIGFKMCALFLIVYILEDKSVDAVAVGVACDNTTNLCDHGLLCQDTKCKLTVDGDCSSTNSGNCGTGLTCDSDHCKIIVDGDCRAANSGKCASGLICDNDHCKLTVGGNCTSGNCATGLTCDHDLCKLTVGGNCTAPNLGNCATGLTCDNNQCRYKNGSECSSHEDLCVNGARCQGATGQKQCVCSIGRTPAAQDGKCQAAPLPGKAGASCGTGALNCTDATDVCDNNLCRYKNGSDCSSHEDLCVDGASCQDASGQKQCVCGIGRTPAAQDGKCQGVKSQSGSANLLTSLLLITSSVMSSCFL